MKNLVTVCIPVFERYDFFENAVNSVLSQTVSCEILVCDNASSHSLFRDFCIQHNITYFRNDENIGMFGNWNKCVELCKTDFFIILSDDDYLKPNFIETFIDVHSNNSKIDIFYSDFEIYDYLKNVILNHHHIIPFGYYANTEIILKYGIQYGLSFPIFASIIRKDIFDNFQTKFHTSADWIWIYGEIKLISIFGHPNKLVVRGSHSFNDTKLTDTGIRCIFAISYIYGVSLKNTFRNTKLNFLSSIRAFSAILNLYAYYDLRKLKNVANDKNNIYLSIYNKYSWLSHIHPYVLRILNKLFLHRYFG